LEELFDPDWSQFEVSKGDSDVGFRKLSDIRDDYALKKIEMADGRESEGRGTKRAREEDIVPEKDESDTTEGPAKRPRLDVPLKVRF
jgi:hypothetical protein